MACDCCGGGQTPPIPDISQKLVIAALLWFAAYFAWSELITWIVFVLLPLSPESFLGNSLHTALKLIGYVTLLLIATTYVATWLQTTIRLETIRKQLNNRSALTQILVGVLFGAILPIGHLDARTLFLGLGQIKKPRATAYAYLCANLLFNQTIIVAIWAVAGLPFALIYVAVAIIACFCSSLLMKTAKLSLPILAVMSLSPPKTEAAQDPLPCIHERYAYANTAMRQTLKNRCIWVIVASIAFAVWFQNPIVGLLTVISLALLTVQLWIKKDPLTLHTVMSKSSSTIVYRYSMTIMALMSYLLIWL